MRLTIIAAIVAFLAVMGACNPKDQQAETGAAAATTENAGEWVSVSIDTLDLNVVKMFRDAMALTVGDSVHNNSMAIGWGGLGVLYQKPVLTVYVSSSRYTYEMIEEAEYFTVTGFPASGHDKVMYLGTASGRDTHDKIKDAGLTVSFTENGTPMIEEGNLTFECRLIYKAPLVKDSLDKDLAKFYDERGIGMHSMYIGEIVNVWEKK